MQDVLIVVDMQNDFIDGVLGTPEAVKIVPKVEEKLRDFEGTVLYTRDTHTEDYMDTQEGHLLPVPHCIRDTYGWQIASSLEKIRTGKVFDKVTFGSAELGEYLRKLDREDTIRSITLVGLCTDICVISNAVLIKAFLPETPVFVDATCCAGVTPERHQRALDAMKACQVLVMQGGSSC